MAGQDLELRLDLGALERLPKELQDRLQGKLQKAAQLLATQAHAHVVEQAQAKLKARREKFLENLRFEQIGPNVWGVIVDQKGRWIEDGMPEHNMLDDLLKSKKAKTAKDGSKYLVIPFKHSGPPSRKTKFQSSLTSTIKAEMKRRDIPYGKIERDESGKPKEGLLHKMDLAGPAFHNPPAGHAGPPGRPTQAHPRPAGQEGPGGRPFLWGVRVYQRPNVNPDGSPRLSKRGIQGASRDIMTFRVASSKQRGTGAWDHPGLEAMNFLDEAFDWARKEWETRILPDLTQGL